MTQQNTFEYPHIENADGILRKLTSESIENLYEGEQKQQALVRLERELGYVKKQGSAAGYLTVRSALRSVNATPNDFCMRGTIAASIISYAIGLTDIEPIGCEPKIYPEFFYGYYGDRQPSFEIIATTELRERLLEYFRHFPGEDPVYVHSNYDEENPDIMRIYIGELKEEFYTNRFYNDTFWIGMSTFDDDEEFVQEFLDDPITRTCKPKTFEECVRCYGLIHGTGTWEQNAESQLFLGFKLSEVITHREDIYEQMMALHLGSRRSYKIAEYVRKGRMYHGGFELADDEAYFGAGGEGWYFYAMTKILYLFTRPHTITLLKRRWKMIEPRLKEIGDLPSATTS